MDEEPSVSYSLREVLDNINQKLDTAINLIHGKADQSRVDEIDVRLRAAEAHITRTELTKQGKAHYREWLIPTLFTAALVVLTTLQALHI